MLKGLGDIGQMMKMQKELKNIQKKIQKMKVEGSSSDEKVKAVVNGEFNLIDISIEESLIKSGDVKKIEKTIISAINDAVDKTRRLSEEEMKKITSGMNLGGLFG
ncbi:MAG: YbaB/EbfC family nucleoid-associated protein [Leptospirales bacterium]|nr:YbaB/EbfC family nucleoid-associated protein [Leptospirales bacterium]